MTRSDVYKNHAFHGQLFQLVEAIDGLDKRGVSATLRTPPLDEWVTNAPRGSDWLFNPGLLDASTHAGWFGYARFLELMGWPPSSVGSPDMERLPGLARSFVCTCWFSGSPKR